MNDVSATGRRARPAADVPEGELIEAGENGEVQQREQTRRPDAVGWNAPHRGVQAPAS